jgi:DNA primase
MPSKKEILEKIDMAQLLEQIGFDDVNPMRDAYLGYCVFHDDQNTKSFSANFTAKLFQCFGCGIKGNAITLYAKWKNISEEVAMLELDQLTTPRSLDSLERQLHISETIPVWRKFELLTAYANNQPLLTSTTLKSYMNDRGITDRTLDAFGVRAWRPMQFQEHEVSSYLDLGVIGMRDKSIYEKFASHPILFPYWDGSRSTVTFIQGRMVEQRKDLPKYTGVKASVTHAYNHGVLHHPNESVFVCEGVIDTLSMAELGYHNTIGIPGVNSFKSSWLDDFHCHKVVLALDNDPAGEGGCKMLTELFSRRGLEVVRFVDHVGCKDVNEYLMKIRGLTIKAPSKIV